MFKRIRLLSQCDGLQHHQSGRRITKATGERRATEFLLQRLSVAIRRGNAAAVLGTVDLSVDKRDAVFSVLPQWIFYALFLN